MKKLLVMMLVIAMSMAMFTGCASDVGIVSGADLSDVVSNEAESVSV